MTYSKSISDIERRASRGTCMASAIMMMIMILPYLGLFPAVAVAAAEEAQVPAMFVFGDSLVDDGNNNFLTSLAKANYYPYGIDFNGGSSGRFTNGRTIVDMLGKIFKMCFKFVTIIFYSIIIIL